jgi:hypothetical protein
MVNPMTHPLEALQEMADDNGTVPYRFALAAAETLRIENPFEGVYGEYQDWFDEGNNPLGVDVGEFVAWVQSLA